MVVRMPQVLTIGVYGWDLDHFLAALAAAKVRLLIDVRQRRGVRGREYAWANAVRLQDALASADIEYRHAIELAPTTEMRQVQYAEDARQGIGKRNRRRLAPEYAARYMREILGPVDLEPFVAGLSQRGATVLLCVERDPEACHRSLIAERLEREHGIVVDHLLP
jgi:uncharacterized protein (DUF488 family)